MLRSAEMSYSNTILTNVKQNPYHNALHGADVMCSSASIFASLSETHVPSEAFSSLVIFSLGIASLLHDFKHLGVNNGYVKNSKHPLSTRYQNGAYLERMHAAEGLLLVKSSGLLDTFTDQRKSSFEFLVTSLILCTDFSRGMKSVELVETAFRDAFELRKTKDKKSFIHKSISTSTSTYLNDKTVIRSKSDVSNLSVSKKKDLSKDVVKSVLGLVIECADLAHPAKPLKLHQRWSVMVTEEFFHQGNLEKENGLDISPMCDRSVHEKDALAWARGQQGFIKFLVTKKYDAISAISNNSSAWNRCMDENCQFWNSKNALTGFNRLKFELKSDITFRKAMQNIKGIEISQQKEERRKSHKHRSMTVTAQSIKASALKGMA